MIEDSEIKSLYSNPEHPSETMNCLVSKTMKMVARI